MAEGSVEVEDERVVRVLLDRFQQLFLRSFVVELAVDRRAVDHRLKLQDVASTLVLLKSLTCARHPRSHLIEDVAIEQVRLRMRTPHSRILTQLLAPRGMVRQAGPALRVELLVSRPVAREALSRVEPGLSRVEPGGEDIELAAVGAYLECLALALGAPASLVGLLHHFGKASQANERASQGTSRKRRM